MSFLTNSFRNLRLNSYVKQCISRNFTQKSIYVPSITITPHLCNIQVNKSVKLEDINKYAPTLQNYYPNAIYLPNLTTFIPFDDVLHEEKSIYAPANSIEEKQAARLIVIRRRKMKKHKLRKLRKRMKFEWAKVRQRREMRKEKAFQAELLAQIRQAEKFSAEQYVTDKLRQATETPLPRFWKGKRLPEFIIRQKLGLDPKKN